MAPYLKMRWNDDDLGKELRIRYFQPKSTKRRTAWDLKTVKLTGSNFLGSEALTKPSFSPR